MKKLYVRVVKAEFSSYWYAKYVGRIFKVTGFHSVEPAFLVRHAENDTRQWISWSDCEPASKELYLGEKL